MEIGIDSFIATLADPVTGVLYDPVVRLQNLLEEVELADRVGLDAFGIGEHHREEFLDSAPVIIMAAAAARTKRIRLTSAVTVLSAADPVRVFQEFATLDLISKGRAEIVAGLFYRGISPLRPRPQRLRHTLFGETRSPAQNPGKLARSLVRQASSSADRSGGLPAPGTESTPRLDWSRRNTGLLRPRWDARSSAHDRHHRW
jgi:hypothetical protein